MIYIVTLNPALDRFIVVEQLLTEDTIRILSETAYAAGKALMCIGSFHKNRVEDPMTNSIPLERATEPYLFPQKKVVF